MLSPNSLAVNLSTNVSNEPPRGKLRDSPNDNHRVSVVSFKDEVLSFGVLFCVGPEQDLNRLPRAGFDSALG